MEAGSDSCPHCGDPRAPRGERCPGCGRTRLLERRHGRRGLIWAVAGLLVCGLLLVVLLATSGSRKERVSAQQRALIAKERARLKREQAPQWFAARDLRPAAGAGEAAVRRARAALVRRAEQEIEREARRRLRQGRLDGPIRASSCKPLSTDPQAVPDDRLLTRGFGRYRCLAEIRDVPGTEGGVVAKFGHPWVAALDFRDFTFVICRDTPAQGERGVALVTVRLDRACLAATGPVVGDGYADVPENRSRR